MKIQLQSLRVINCGPLRDVCIHFNTDGDSPVTVLAGANGSGKTTALELIAALFELVAPDAESLPIPAILNKAGYAEVKCLVENESVTIYFGKPPAGSALGDNNLGRPNPINKAKEKVQGDLLPDLRFKFDLQRISIDIAKEEQGVDDLNYLMSEPPAERILVPLVCYFPYTRFLPPFRGEQIQKEQTVHDWVYRYEVARSFKGSLDSYLIWLEYAEPEAFNRVTNFLRDLNFDGKTFAVRRRELKAIVTTSNGATHYLEELSSGEQNILIMLLELRRRLRLHSIVLIDEIENSLHPAFQHRIVNGLKRMQEIIPFQLIVSSHSLTILEAFGPQSARILTQF